MSSISPSLKLLLKLVVSVILALLILWKFPISEISANLQNVKIGWFFASFLFCELIIINQACRWYNLLIVPKEQKPEFSILLKYTTISYFFNSFAPGGVGGDVYRSVALGRAIIANNVASVFINKISGLLALCLLFWLALPYYDQIPKQAIWFMVAVSLFLIGICLFTIFNPLKKGKIGEIAEKLREYRAYPFRLLISVLGSLVMQILAILSQISLFYAVGIEVRVALVFVIVPVTLLVTTIPISFNGIGVREWTMLSLTAAAINSEQLLASSLLSYAVVISQAIQGWVIFTISPLKK
jgi:uncharacterized membrane protein YbhN (UPF0104 family)